jgi:protein-S-isoprenylcysteine O-methyltransferase Ste14
MKRTGLIITISSIILFSVSATDLFDEKNWPTGLTVPVFLIGVVGAFVGPAVFLFSFSELRRQKIANIILILSLMLIMTGVVCVFLHTPGARVEIVLGALILCFTYGTLALKNKYDKWKVYTRSNRDAFFLSLFDFIGVAALVLGMLFKLQSWPWAEQMMVIGMTVLAFGIFAWNQKFKKEVIFRKKTEDRLQESLDEIESQHKKLEEKQKEIIDSITYARRIQKSLLPTERYIENTLKRLKE